MSSNSSRYGAYVQNRPPSFIVNTVDASIREYVSEEGWVAWSKRFRCLNWSLENEATLALDIGGLFWSTQTKQDQLHFWDLSSSTEFPSGTDRLFCGKCGKWIPLEDFASHLNTQQLLEAKAARDFSGWQIDDSTPLCQSVSATSLSNAEFLLETQYRERCLRLDDWPVVCKTCHCIVMKSYLSLHRSSQQYCHQASLAVTIAGGVLSNMQIYSRFSWYPGNPRLHLYRVGKWTVATLLALHTLSLQRMLSWHNAFLPLVFLHSLDLPEAVNVLVFDMLFADDRDDLSWISMLIWNSQTDVARFAVRHRVRSHFRRFESALLQTR